MAQLTTPFAVNPGSEVPVSLQLSWRLRSLISSGRIGPGEPLPSVRSLAEWAGVNVNTVRAVYSALEEQGLVETRHGAGTFAIENATSSPQVETIAAGALEEATAAGIDPRDVAVAAMALVDLAGFAPDPGEPETLPDPGLESNQLAARQSLREQIDRLEARLAGVWHQLDPVERPRSHRRGPHVASVEELEETRDLLLEQLRRSESAAMDREDGRRLARQRREQMLADPAAHAYERVSAAELGEPGCAEWAVEPRYGALGALMSWWRVKVSGGCPLPAPLAAAAKADADDQGGS